MGLVPAIGFRRLLVAALILAAVASMRAQTSADRIVSVDHYVRINSTAPAMRGQIANLYVRERTLPETALRGNLGDRVVLFIHGTGTPAEVAYDPSSGDHSWMTYLADAGFDVFAMDQTGYGRSTRPGPMDDPCNLSRDQQAQLVPAVLAAPCSAKHTTDITTLSSDWGDIDAVVNYIRTHRRVDRVHLVAWPLGGARAGGYTARHPEK